MMIFVNLPVADLAGSMRFYEALGFRNNPQFTDETAACMVLSEQIYVMLLTHPKFTSFLTRPMADAKKKTGALYAISCASREAVDAMMATAISHGGVEYRPAQDHGFMYGRAFADRDGHVWEPFWMDPAAVPSQ